MAVICLILLMALPIRRCNALARPTPRQLLVTALYPGWRWSWVMTLLMFALQGGKVGDVSTLSALSPVLDPAGALGSDHGRGPRRRHGPRADRFVAGWR